MKNLIKGAGKKTLATSILALSSVAVFASGNNGAVDSTNGVAVVGFVAIVVGALLVPALGHKTHH
jgi:hypothetical protein